jgi:hypothetical protein
VNYAKLLEMNSFFTLHIFLEVGKTQDLQVKFGKLLEMLSVSIMDGKFDTLSIHYLKCTS